MSAVPHRDPARRGDRAARRRAGRARPGPVRGPPVAAERPRRHRLRGVRRVDRLAYAKLLGRLSGVAGRRPRHPEHADARRPRRSAVRQPRRPALRTARHRAPLRGAGDDALAPYGGPRAVRRTGRPAHRRVRGRSVRLGGVQAGRGRARFAGRAARRAADGAAVRDLRGAAGPGDPVRARRAAGAGPAAVHARSRYGAGWRERAVLAGAGRRRRQPQHPALRPAGTARRLARPLPGGRGPVRGLPRGARRRRAEPGRPGGCRPDPRTGGDGRRHAGRGRVAVAGTDRGP